MPTYGNFKLLQVLSYGKGELLEDANRVGLARKLSHTVEASFHLEQMKMGPKPSEWLVWLAKTPVYLCKTAVNFMKYSLLVPNSFEFLGKKYKYFYHPYNVTWDNERCIEVPIALDMVTSAKGKAVLEVGNVLSHYCRTSHEILDKYEVGKGVINEDIVGFSPAKKYDAIVSISTLEHVGYDEVPKEPKKIIAAFHSLEEICSRNGKILVTIPLGYNPAADLAVLENRLPMWKWAFIKRINSLDWAEVGVDEAKKSKFGAPFPAANCMAIGIRVMG